MASNTTLCANSVNSHSTTSGTTVFKQNVRNISSNESLTLADSGAVIVPSGTARTITLPAVASSAGFHVKILMGSDANHVVNGGGAKIQGFVYDNTNGTTHARTAITNKTSITLVNGERGDVLNIHGDGTNFYVNGILNNTPTLG
tara:strand:- start:67 stop:501 length:435 start_codon:yes stop_codon:yes gene_type:complete